MKVCAFIPGLLHRMQTDDIAFGIDNQRDVAILTYRFFRRFDFATRSSRFFCLNRAVNAAEVNHNRT